MLKRLGIPTLGRLFTFSTYARMSVFGFVTRQRGKPTFNSIALIDGSQFPHIASTVRRKSSRASAMIIIPDKTLFSLTLIWHAATLTTLERFCNHLRPLHECFQARIISTRLAMQQKNARSPLTSATSGLFDKKKNGHTTVGQIRQVKLQQGWKWFSIALRAKSFQKTAAFKSGLRWVRRASASQLRVTRKCAMMWHVAQTSRFEKRRFQ